MRASKLSIEELEIEGIILEIHFVYYKGRQGQRDSLAGIPGAGPALEPDEPAEIEIYEVYHKEEAITELLSELILLKIETKLYQLISEEIQSTEWDRWEARHNQKGELIA